MIIKQISYTRRFSLDNYEHEDINLLAEVQEGEDIVAAITAMQIETIKASIITKRKQRQKENE